MNNLSCESDKLYCIDWLPKNWRTLQKIWNSKENYEEQLALNIKQLVSIWLNLYEKNWEVKLLDIWWNNSKALKELKEMLVEAWIPNNKILLSKIDISDVIEGWVQFIKWDLENDDFLLQILEKLWKDTQWIIFMNQVTQYLWDRLKVIKFIAEYLLINWWSFTFNLITKSFDSWEAHISTLFDRLNEIIEDESDWFKITIKTPTRIPDCLCYEVIKHNDKAELSIPKYRRTKSIRDVDWFKTATYDYRLRTLSLTVEKEINDTNKKINSSI